MTYTFKLARRLAVSRGLCMLPVLLVLAACSGENTTAPEGNPAENTAEPQPSRDLTPVMLLVSPGNLTIETNQLIQFRAHGRTDAGDSVGAAVTWRASGGTILPDGRFSAAAIGTFTVIARSRVRADLHEDTTLVHVVRRQAKLASIQVTPGSASLTPGLTQTFTAIGHLKGGSTVPIGVTWSSTGGSIDPDGTYMAGDTAGTYRVVATNTAGTLSDTASVTISAPPSPPPPPPPGDSTPQPAPTLAQVKLLPGSVTLAPSTSKQFLAYGRTTAGDSVAVAVAFTASGGSITPGGLFTAGSTYGTFRVIATAGTLADTSVVTVTVPLGSNAPVGLPFGPSQQLSRTNQIHQPFTMTADGGYTPSNIVSRINAARAGGYKIMLQLPSGSHKDATSPLMSVIDGVLQFDGAKWRAIVDQFNTSTIRQAVADGVRDGVIIGDVVMDEPQVGGAGDGNTWGPKGTMTKLRVDSLCGYIKQVFPTMPAGVFHQHNTFEPTKSYYVCDFIVDQYNDRRGDVTQFRDDGLALARRDGHAIMFSLNILDGGVQDKDGVYDCAGTGGFGSFAPNCRMTPEQVREWGLILGPVGCGLFMWRYDDAFIANPDNQQAFRDIAARMATQPKKTCTRQ
jgi:hypothetical protein